jgi:exosortase/archaeosortase family protein
MFPLGLGDGVSVSAGSFSNTEHRRWVHYALAAFMAPIAIVTNAIRIEGAGILGCRFRPSAAEGFFHEFSGWATSLVAPVLTFGSDWILQHTLPSVVSWRTHAEFGGIPYKA